MIGLHCFSSTLNSLAPLRVVIFVVFTLYFQSACDDTDNGGTGPDGQQEYIDVYVVSSINGKPAAEYLKNDNWNLPTMLNVRFSEEDSTFSGYVHINSADWLPISETYNWSYRFEAVAPDSLKDVFKFVYEISGHNESMITGVFRPSSPHVDWVSYTFTAMLRSVPSDSVRDDEYYFAPGPGMTKVFVVESIGGLSPDSLSAERNMPFPLMMELRHDNSESTCFEGRVYFTLGGWIDVARNMIRVDSFTVTSGERFHDLNYEPPILSGNFTAERNHPLPFVSRRIVVPIDSLPEYNP